MNTHELKVWPEFTWPLLDNLKNFEIRKNDRDFKVGDLLILKTWSPDLQQYLGDVYYRRVIYILKGGRFGLEKGFVAMSLVPEPPPQGRN